MRSVRVLVAGDHQAVRDGLRLMLGLLGIEVAGAAAGGTDAVRQAAAGIAPVAKSMAAHTPWPCTAATGPAPAAAVDAVPTMPGSLALAAGQQNTNPRMV